MWACALAAVVKAHACKGLRLIWCKKANHMKTILWQAELVAQFLCCIPLATVEVVLAWLKPVVPEEEQIELLNHVSHNQSMFCSLLCC